jgi:hypothetical protein
MPRYLVERRLGAITDDDLQAAVDRTTLVREKDFPEVVWEHTHVVRDDGGLTGFCVYMAPDPETIRDVSQAAGIPADRIYEIHSDIVPHGPG